VPRRKSFQSGKLFAQRQSFWDALFTVLNSRDRDWLSMLIQLIVTTVVNFTTGLTVSVFVFLARLPSLLMSYQPSLWSALLFFAAAAVGAISVVASYLVSPGGGCVSFFIVYEKKLGAKYVGQQLVGHCWGSLLVAKGASLLVGRPAHRTRSDFGRGSVVASRLALQGRALDCKPYSSSSSAGWCS
jgi:hypothetical protein